MTQSEAILAAMKALKGTRHWTEIKDWTSRNIGDHWKDYSTPIDDMVLGGNNTSNVPLELRVFERVSPGYYRLLEDVGLINA